MTGVRLLLFVAAVGLLRVWAQVPTEDPFDDTTDRIIVQFKHSVHDMQTTELETALAELDEHVPLGTGLQMVRHSSAGLVMKVAGGGRSPLELEATIANMTNHPQVASVEIDTRIQSLIVPDDTLYPIQWNLQESSRYRQGMNLPSAWAMAPKLGRGVVVGVIDSGIAPHVDLPNVLPGVCPKGSKCCHAPVSPFSAWQQGCEGVLGVKRSRCECRTHLNLISPLQNYMETMNKEDL